VSWYDQNSNTKLERNIWAGKGRVLRLKPAQMPTVRVFHVVKPLPRFGSGSNPNPEPLLTLHIAKMKEAYQSSNKSITFDRCSSTMAGVPVLTISKRHCHILHSKAGTILTLQYFSTYYLLPINGEAHPDPSVTSPNNWLGALYPPCITAGISFERNACPRSVQKYQINPTQRCIRRFRNSQLCTAILIANCRELGTQC